MVRQRRRRSDAAVAVGSLPQPCKPTLADDDIGVEHDHVRRRCHLERPIDVHGEPHIPFAPEVEQDPLGFVDATQFFDELAGARIRAGVVTDEDRNLGRGVGEDAAQAADEVLVPSIDGHAHHDLAALRPERGAGLDPPHVHGPIMAADRTHRILAASGAPEPFRPEWARPLLACPPMATQSAPVYGPSALGGDIRRFVELTLTLARTEFKLRYFGSVLGYLWSLVRPLLFFGVLYFVFTVIFQIGKGDPPLRGLSAHGDRAMELPRRGDVGMRGQPRAARGAAA